MARPKEFDQEKALRKAIRLFSQQGFAATSTDDLMRVMEVGRQSMYDTFGDKKLYPGDYNRAEADSVDHRVWTETGCTCVLLTSTKDVIL